MSHPLLPQLIAIDGPAASGKTTIGQMLAEKLGYLLLDTGSMYRAVTLAALQQNINIHDEQSVVQLAQQIQIEILPAESPSDGRMYTVLVAGKDVTWALRAASVDAHVSQISAYKPVREEMVKRQQLLAKKGPVVMVGRDIGTVVVPNAPLKLYVTASPEERARRRWQERQERGSNESYETILIDVLRRDQIDSQRQHSPLRPAEDAVIIDTTGCSPDDVLAKILCLTLNSELL